MMVMVAWNREGMNWIMLSCHNGYYLPGNLSLFLSVQQQK